MQKPSVLLQLRTNIIMAVGTRSRVSAEVSAGHAVADPASPTGFEGFVDCSLNLLTNASCKRGTWTVQRTIKGFRTSA